MNVGETFIFVSKTACNLIWILLKTIILIRFCFLLLGIVTKS